MVGTGIGPWISRCCCSRCCSSGTRRWGIGIVTERISSSSGRCCSSSDPLSGIDADGFLLRLNDPSSRNGTGSLSVDPVWRKAVGVGAAPRGSRP